MAFGTPTDGGAAYSAAGGGGTSVAPAYPAGIQADDVLVLIIGQKPSTANGGTVTTPSNWTLRESITGQGGYGATLGADTGNTNLFIYTKDVVDGTETGNLTVTVGTNNVCWGIIVRIPGGGGTSFSYGTADGTRATAPTSGTAFTTTLTNGTTAPNLQSGDMAIWAMCIPTDVLNNGFATPTISSTGTTFGTAVELEEPDSGSGNDIGGYVAYAEATSGSSTAAPTVGVTATGTVTNVRGPIALIRVRDTSQTLTPSLYTNTPAFFGPTVTAGAVNLSPGLFTNTPQFFAPTAEASNTLTSALFTNTPAFFAATVTQATPAQNLSPALYTNTPAFFAASVAQALTPNLYTNTPQFFAATVTAGAVNLSPALYTNTPQFFGATVTAGAVNLSPALYTNTPQFFSAAITQDGSLAQITRFTNTPQFFTATLTAGPVTLTQNTRFTNTPQFFTAALVSVLTQNTRYTNTPQFFAPTATASNTLTPARYTNTPQFFAATLTKTNTLVPALYTNTPQFFAHTLTPGAVALTQATRFTNTPQFFGGTVVVGQSLVQATRYTNTPAFFTANLTKVNPLTPALFTNTPAFFTANLTKVNPLVQATRFTNTPQFFGGTVQQGQFLTFEPYVVSDYVSPPGYVEYIAYYNNVFFTGNLELQISVSGLQSDTFVGTVSQTLASVVVPTGSAIDTGVGYVNIWGLVDDTQFADWQHIDVTQDPDWVPIDSCTC